MLNPGATVLVIEDDPQIRKLLHATLSLNGFQFVEATNAKEGLLQVASRTIDLIILDLGLPDEDGLEVTKQLRSWTNIPIIILSARGREKDKVAALDAGADDYIAKPFGVGELMARLRVALRHSAQADPASSTIFTVEGLRIDFPRREVQVDEKAIYLTPIEYRLLTALARHAGKVLTHQQLLQEVWGPAYVNQVQYLRVFMGHLRRKIEKDPTQPRYLLTEQGIGYRLYSE